MKIKGIRAITVAAVVGFAACETVSAADSPELGWISGMWCQHSPDELIEEFWLAPRGGELVGLSRTTKGEKTISFEFARIAMVDGVPNYLAQPGGRAPTAFKRSLGGENWIRFENAAHDFPKRIEYRRIGDELHAEISGPGSGDEPMRIEFKYSRCAS